MSLARRTIELRIIFSLLKEAEKFLQRERERERRECLQVLHQIWWFVGRGLLQAGLILERR